MCAHMQAAAKQLSETTKPLVARIARLEQSCIKRVCVLSPHISLVDNVHPKRVQDHNDFVGCSHSTDCCFVSCDPHVHYVESQICSSNVDQDVRAVPSSSSSALSS